MKVQKKYKNISKKISDSSLKLKKSKKFKNRT